MSISTVPAELSLHYQQYNLPTDESQVFSAKYRSQQAAPPNMPNDQSEPTVTLSGVNDQSEPNNIQGVKP